jgi:hypothetical protein
MSALAGMSMITHAYADTATLTPEQIERMYIAEMKVPGKALRCFQNGIEIVNEVGLQDVKEDKARIVAVRLDGNRFEIILSGDVACTVITRKGAE